MVREIKFRGKRVDNGEWAYGYLAVYTDGSCYITTKIERNITRYVKGKPFYIISRMEYEVDPETVGQYTGSEDKKGVKAYEGDIVKCTESFPDELEFISKIFWGGSGFLVKKGAIYYPVDIYDSNPGRVSLNKMEIIGNTHDNPELLEVPGND